MKFKKSNQMVSLAEQAIPEQTMTMAKKASNFPKEYPKYLESGFGCELIDIDGNKFIDYSMSLGVYTLGYNYPAVIKKVKKHLDKGTIFSLPHPIEVELAKKVNQIIPSAEKSRFFKNGADTTGCAIRLARSHTSKKHIIQSGYHGHHDWYSFVLRDRGTLNETKKYTHSVPYNNFQMIKDILGRCQSDVAAIIIETAFEKPQEGYLEALRQLCDEENIVLIFDEMWTGFRFSLGGIQELLNVKPDLSTFSKGISNGFPISVLAGNNSIMDEFENIWGFTTFGGDSLPMVAALETIEQIEHNNVIRHIWDYGAKLREGLNVLINQNQKNDSLKLIGYDCRFMFEQNDYFNSHKFKIQERLVEKGILWNNMFVPSFSHENIHLDKTLEAFDYALKTL
tara:strand:+ start:4175 stop:5362 length:1188 start_codon:yes stop_codon:yes gene_type:complete